MRLNLQGKPEEVMRAVEALQQYAAKRNVPEKTIFDLALALEECGSNIVNHALQRDPTRAFKIMFHRRGEKFFIELRDRGPKFDPTRITPRKPQAEDDDLPGGWGIELVRRRMDEIRYRRAGQENVLRLTKRLVPAAEGK